MIADFTDTDARAETLAVDELVALMASGLSQRDASVALWAQGSPLHDALALEVAAGRMRTSVRTGILAAVPWLRLPDGAA